LFEQIRLLSGIIHVVETSVLPICPRCGQTEDVRTVQQLFDLLNSFLDDATNQAEELRRQPTDSGPPSQDWLISDQSPRSSEPGQEIADVVVASTSRLLGRMFRKQAHRSASKAMDSLAERSTHDREQSTSEQRAIAERYPDLYGCLADQILFLSHGSQVVPIADISMPITLVQADAIVARLHQP
jgi:hypothetical protein